MGNWIISMGLSQSKPIEENIQKESVYVDYSKTKSK